ncbi:MAG TPA: hypothetical protein VLG11_05705 [Candidatus Saccharimonadales bacterium]|nr:hypothetical protein [Candidatus Saccharimonadales bacterium]
MDKQTVATTKNGKLVYVDLKGSHAATHIADTPELLSLVRELLADLSLEDDNIYLDKDMGREVGLSDLVTTDEDDHIIYAKRLNRSNYTRFVQNRLAEPTRYVTVVLRKDTDGNYELWSAWIGAAAPQFPGDEHETPESRPFWQTHALVWGNQEVQPGTQVEYWPWG